MTAEEKVLKITEAADDMKAEQIETLDVRNKTSVAEFFIVCSGTSDRHIDSIAERVAEKLAISKIKALRIEGERSGWVLQDYGDVIFHVMKEEQRQFYDLETLWKNAAVDPNLPR
jgi:ribosome-associated protein